MTRPFRADQSSFSISVTSTASTGAAFGNAPAVNSDNTTVRIVNEGPNRAYIAVGSSTVAATVPSGTAASTATPILPGEDITVSVIPGHTHISAICRSSETATLIVSGASDGV